jgi:hypothetical protein
LSSRRALLPAVLLTLLLLPSAGHARAADPEPTRAEYVERLEAICRPASRQTEAAVRGVRGDLKSERLRSAAAKLAAADRIFSATVARIALPPRPAADRAKLATWFGYLAEQRRYLGMTAAALRAGRTIASQHATARFVHTGNLANRTVLAFGFHYCSFDFARFG